MTTVAELLQPVESDLDALLADLRALIGAGHPILQAAAEHLFSAGGKRIRPGIVLLLSRAIAPAQAAVFSSMPAEGSESFAICSWAWRSSW